MAMAVPFSTSTSTSTPLGLVSPRLGALKGWTESFGASSFESFMRLTRASPCKLQCQGSYRERSKEIQAAAAAGVDLLTVGQKQEQVLPRGPSWAVHKFGGTCVGNVERIQNVAKIIIDDPSERKVAVVSAMSKVTDMMYDLIRKAQARDDSYNSDLDVVHATHKETAVALLEDGHDLTKFLGILESDINNLRAMLRAIYIAGLATETFEDWVVGHGELWSAQLLAATVRKGGLPCVWMDARDVIVVTPTGKLQVDPVYEASAEKLDKWYSRYPSDTVIVTGFIASTTDDIPTTLKRDGSDLSAAIMGSLFQASRVTIWTDVDGVFSADPRKVSEAVILKSLSYQEAWEMSYFGANVLHPRTTIPVMKSNIPVTIRNIFNVSAIGTEIRGFSDSETLQYAAKDFVKGFTTVDNIALVNVEGTGMAGVPGTASDIFDAVKGVGANVVMISQASSEHSVCFAVPMKEVDTVSRALETKFRRDLDSGRLSKVEVVKNCCLLAAVGQRMASTPGVSATLFTALAKANINVRAIAQGCSEYNITVVVDQADSIKALKAVHSRFYLSKIPIAVGLVGPGLIGKTLLDQFRDQAASLKEDFHIDLRVMGIIDSNTMYLCDTGVDLANWRELIETQGCPADMSKFTAHMQNHSLPNTVIIDCTASVKVAEKYYDWMQKRMHIITPNKKANSGPYEQYANLKELQRQSYTHYFYEATVGAGLPIVSTLRGLLETGDKIVKVEGIFSGTLSYIFNSFDGTKCFSQIVKEAKAAGYTEPDPRDDLSGMDVARKVIILARECGLQLQLDDIKIDKLLPESLSALDSVDEFLEKLPSFDAEIEAQRKDADSSGMVLRFVGIVDVKANQGAVKLVRLPKSDPFAQLSGTDNIIAFTSKRYSKDQRLIVRGPGAGAEVTAAGVFSDLLRLASYLGAPS